MIDCPSWPPIWLSVGWPCLWRLTARRRRSPPKRLPQASRSFFLVGADPVELGLVLLLAQRRLHPLHRYYEAVRPSPAHRYFRPRGWSRLRLFPCHRRPGSHVPYKSLVSFASSTCRMPLGQSQDIPRADPKGRAQPLVLTSSNPLSTLHRRFACARLSRPACRNLVPTFPQRSPPLHLTTAACGGLRSAPDC